MMSGRRASVRSTFLTQARAAAAAESQAKAGQDECRNGRDCRARTRGSPCGQRLTEMPAALREVRYRPPMHDSCAPR